MPLKFISAEAEPLHITTSRGSTTVGVGFIVIPIVWGNPLQVREAFNNWGVTVTVPVTAFTPLFNPWNAGISPIPFKANPMEGVELDHVYEVPVPVNVRGAVEAVLQIVWSAISFTIGVGLIVIVKLWAAPEQFAFPPEKSGVAVIVATIGKEVLFWAVKGKILPIPLLERPILGELFTQL